MLSAKVDKVRRYLFKRFQNHNRAIDAYHTFAVGAQRARNDELVVKVYAKFVKFRLSFFANTIENCLNFHKILAGSKKRLIRLRAQHKTYGVDKNALAGARLP